MVIGTEVHSYTMYTTMYIVVHRYIVTGTCVGE